MIKESKNVLYSYSKNCLLERQLEIGKKEDIEMSEDMTLLEFFVLCEKMEVVPLFLRREELQDLKNLVEDGEE